MSYFSHNPEKWDEIERRGVADFILSRDPDRDEDELLEKLEDIQYSSPETWRAMTRDAHEEIEAQSQDFWGEMAQAAIDRIESQR